MPQPWTAEIVGKMHLYGIRGGQLAKQLGWTRQYLSQVLNSKRNVASAEQKVREALETLHRTSLEE